MQDNDHHLAQCFHFWHGSIALSHSVTTNLKSSDSLPDSINLNSPITSKCQTKVLPIVCCPLHNTVTLNKYKDFNTLPDELLLAACKNDQDDMLDDIFKEGSYDINFRDGAGNTAAHYA